MAVFGRVPQWNAPFPFTIYYYNYSLPPSVYEGHVKMSPLTAHSRRPPPHPPPLFIARVRNLHTGFQRIYTTTFSYVMIFPHLFIVCLLTKEITINELYTSWTVLQSSWIETSVATVVWRQNPKDYEIFHQSDFDARRWRGQRTDVGNRPSPLLRVYTLGGWRNTTPYLFFSPITCTSSLFFPGSPPFFFTIQIILPWNIFIIGR